MPSVMKWKVVPPASGARPAPGCGPARFVKNGRYLPNLWNAGLCSHPGDGLLAIYDVHLKPGQLPASASPPAGRIPPAHPGIPEPLVPAQQVGLERALP